MACCLLDQKNKPNITLTCDDVWFIMNIFQWNFDQYMHKYIQKMFAKWEPFCPGLTVLNSFWSFHDAQAP